MRRTSPQSPARRAWVVAAVAVGLLAASCGGPAGPRIYPTRGKVLHKGKPAVGAKVIFQPRNSSDPQALVPTGIVGADGSFRLTTHKPDDGAPVGHYTVFVIWPGGPARAQGLAGKQHSEDRLKGVYCNPARPRLQAEVAEGDNELPAFELR